MDSRYAKYIKQTMKNGLPIIVIEGVEIPSTVEVCHLCRGKGSHVNPDIDSHGITGSEMEELGEDFREAYSSGAYDIECVECNGNKVIAVINHEACNIRQLALVDKQMEYIQQDNEERYCRSRGIEY